MKQAYLSSSTPIGANGSDEPQFRPGGGGARSVMLIEGTGAGAVRPWNRAISLVITAIAITMPAAAIAQESGGQSAPAAVMDLQALAWMAGSWVQGSGDSRTEEQWLAPAADCMLGMCRITNGGKLNMYEMMAIERGPDGICMWMRHYRLNLADREKTPIRWTLASANANEAVFDAPPGERFAKLVYKRAGGDSMQVSLVPREIGTRGLEFEFKRAGKVEAAKP